jgi:hypothetical protein
MDSIAVLDSGRLASYGSYQEVEIQSAKLLQQAEQEIGSVAQLEGHQNDVRHRPESETSGTVNQSGTSLSNMLNLQRSNGNWTVYSYYSRAAGSLSLLLLVLFTVMSSITANYMSKMLLASFIMACDN